MNDTAKATESRIETEGLSVEKFRLEAVRRNLTVVSVQSLTPGMMRVRLQGSELNGFSSPSPDDHIKVFFPMPDGTLQGRDYTPRAFSAEQNVLTLDFALHESGIASDWVRSARAGMPLQIGGPRGTTVITAPGAWWLLVGDETSLPSIARRLEEMEAGTPALAVVAVTDGAEELAFRTKSALHCHWVHRPKREAALAEPLLTMLQSLSLPHGPGFVWVAAEGGVAQAVRSYFADERGHPIAWIKASSYWSATTGERNG